MKYRHLNFDEINLFLENSKEIDFNYIVIVLVNGDNLIGRLDKYSDSIKHNQICLSHYKGAIHFEFFIPFNDIAGISLSNILQNTEEVERKIYNENDSSLDSKILNVLIEKSKEHNYKSETSFINLRISSTVFIPKGITSKNTYELLHCNWQYLTRNRKTYISGGGISIIGFGVSIGRKENTEKYLQNKIKRIFCKKPDLRIPISIDLACQTEIIIKGYIQFVENNNEIQTTQMDDKIWLLVYVSKKKVNCLQELNATDWCLGAISKNNSVIPIDCLDNIETPVSLYGDIITARYMVGTYEINKLLKIEAVAIVPE